MPLHNLRFANGIFYCTETGQITAEDALTWQKALQKFALASPRPIVAIIDAMQTPYVTAAARQIFGKAINHTSLHKVVIAADDFTVRQNARLIALMGLSKNIEIFNSLELARDYAQQHARLLLTISPTHGI